MIDLWYKDAVIYCLDIETFLDGNGDGIGDFAGLTRRLDYIAGLDATCIWLLPFYPSPNRDNGYDVMDYYGVDGRLGTLGDFVEFTHKAREQGLRIIVDLVVNHTSDQHPWFQAARRDPASPYRDFYVWSAEEPADRHQGMVFPGVQDSVWSWDEEAGAWYFHRFYRHQPDLNIANPAVREEIEKIMGFWLQLGVSGFRIDAAPFLIELPSADEHADDQDPYRYLGELRDFLSWRRGDGILLAEANVETDKIREYFGTGDRMHMLFDFIVNQQMFLALAQRRAEPLARAFSQLPAIPAKSQWANFVRNHDELDLGRLAEAERRSVFAQFAPDPSMRLYGRGIRRRLPPMVDGDERRIRLAYSLMLSAPGTPVIRYGEEIGMGDDLSRPERESVRTPMQWSDEANGGFSTAPADRLIRPVVDDGPFGYRRVNVAAQQRDPESLLTWMQHAVRVRRSCPEFGWGALSLVETGDPAVLAHRCDWRDQTVLAVHNLDDRACTATLQFDLGGDGLFDLLLDGAAPLSGDSAHRIELEPYDCRWFRLGGTRR